ncbi:MAG: hypothetical protein KatS3mg031_2711 [Chitinophagales bacterium]|nr:MAG: hypothetical protein KatS3mg031_2711 [Chitinophagales bacterium]
MRLLVAFLIVFLFAVLLLWHYLPVLLVKSLSGETAVQIVPDHVRTPVTQEIERMPGLLDELRQEGIELTLDDLIEAIDKASVAEITAVMSELEKKQITSRSQLVEILLKNMHLGKLHDKKILMEVLQKVEMQAIQKWVQLTRDYGKPYPLTVPLAKETLKGLLIARKKEVERQLNR